MPLRLHIGLPKTGTTLLQHHLFRRHSQVEYLGKFAREKDKYRDAEVRSLVEPLLRRPDRVDRSTVGDQGRDLLDAARLESRVVIWSSEGMSGGTLQRRRLRAENFRCAFGDPRVVVTLRRPTSWLRSMYLQKLKQATLGPDSRWGERPRYFGFVEWLEENWRRPTRGALSHLDYAGTVALYEDLVGRDSVEVLLFEDLQRDPESFVRRLCRFLGIDTEEAVRLCLRRGANRRWSAAQVAWTRAVARSPIASRLAALCPLQVRRLLLQAASTRLPGVARPAVPVLPEVWRKQIAEFTRAGNRRLARERGLDLEAHGYPL